MKINEIIARADKYCPNTSASAEKVSFINAAEGQLVRELSVTYGGVEYADFLPYDPEDGARSVMLPAPYDEAYVHYIAAMIYLSLHEQAHYNNELSIYKSIISDYKTYLIRTKRPVGSKRRRIR